MHYVKSWLPAAMALLLAACSSSSGSPPSSTPPAAPPPAPSTMISGGVVDEIVINAAVTAYPVSSTGAVGGCIQSTPATSPVSCATATTNSSGTYTINLGTYTGAVLLQATGGTYTDLGTGQTVPLPAGLTLSALLPTVAPGTGVLTAQINPLTTMVAELALQQASQGTSLATADANADAAVGGYFGGLSNLVATLILDASNASCSAGATQANYDATLVLDGIAELASTYKVTSGALAAAIRQDILLDHNFDGLANGVPIMVPLASGSGSVALTTIYGSSLAQSIEASIGTFVTSTANACKIQQSAGAKTRMSKKSSQQIASDEYSYTLNGNYVLTGTYVNPPGLQLSVGLACGSDYPQDIKAHQGSLSLQTEAQPTPFNVAIGLSPAPDDGTGVTIGAGAPVDDWSNSCGTNSWTLSIVYPGQAPPPAQPPQTCSFLPGSPTTGTFPEGTSNGNVNTFTLPENIVIACNTGTFSVGGLVSGLAAGGLFTLADTASGASVTISSNGNFVLDSNLAQGTAYDVVISGVTGGQSCSFVGTPPSGSISGANVSLAVVCSTPGGGGTGAAINSPQGMVFYKGLLYVANAGGNQVLVFSETLNVNQVQSIAQTAVITSPNMVDPVRLAIDASGFLYVASLGTGNGTGTITVYNTNNNYKEVTGAGGGALLTGQDRPLGIAVDGAYNLYVADNYNDAVGVYVPITAGTPSAGYAALITLHADKAGNYFYAPGVIYEQNLSSLLGAGNDYVLLGLGPSSLPNSVIMYNAPFTVAPSPDYDLTNSSCSTMPTGPTAIALYANLNEPLESMIYIASYYNNNVVQYVANNFIGRLGGTVNTCPTPVTNANGINHAEGLAVDALGNVFVSNAGSSGANANTIAVYPGGWSINNEAPVFVYPPP
jgi:hypothetical protein